MKNGIYLTTTANGYPVVQFKDQFNNDCELKETGMGNTVTLGIEKQSSTIYLTPERVQDLLPLLEHYAKTGRLPAEPTS